VLRRARKIEGQLVDWRRDFHMYPEPGFQETRTAARVAEVMQSLGYRVRTGVARTGVVAEMGQGPPIVAVRADMDALPIQEAGDTPYVSRVPGMMHACGHDAHTAMALGVATLLAGETLPGTIRFLFQPSEEVDDEQGLSGAPRMVADGAMDGVDAVLGFHVDVHTPTGNIRVASGPASAGADTFYATILGRGGHGAMPHSTIDPIYIAGHVILAVHGIVSRRLHPSDPAVISIGSIHGGAADNVIPNEVEMTGTIRFLDPEAQKQLHAEIGRAMEVARALGGDYRLRINNGCLPMINDMALVEIVRRVAAEMLGAEHVLQPAKDEMGGEDFASFSSLAPGVMFMLGCRIEGDERKPHNPRFDIDERCLPIGVAVMAEAVRRRLSG